MKRLQIKYVTDKVQIAMKRCKTKGKKYTVKDILDDNTVNELTRLDEGYRIFKSIRGSPPYFEQRKRDLFAMIRQLGLPTWFVSLSAADIHWTDLLQCLAKLVDNKELTYEQVEELEWGQKTRLVQSDPVTCVRYFDHRVQLFINNVLKSHHEPIGKITDFFYRVEFQQRGSPHIHMVVWVDNAPVFDNDTDDTVSDFIDTYISCSTNVQTEASRHIDLQRHKHSKSCRKKGQGICRFGFPHAPMKTTRILRPLHSESDENQDHNEQYDKIKTKLTDMKDGVDISFEQMLNELDMTEEEYIKALRSSLTEPKVFLQRTPSEIRINPYMKSLLHAWKANQDVQYIMDAYACAMYIVAYISKSQKGMSQLLDGACKEAKKENMSLRESVKHIGNKFLNSVEISAQEAAYLVLQLPISKATRSVIFINTSPPDERTFMLKDKSVLQDMPENSTDIECSNIIKRYSQRPKALTSWTLADFASKIDVKYPNKIHPDPFADNEDDNEVHDGNIDDDDDDNEAANELQSSNNATVNIVLKNGITYKQRKNPCVIRYVRFNKKTDLENFCRERLMLFFPWKNETKDLIGPHSCYFDHYMTHRNVVEEKAKEYEHNGDVLDDAQQRAESDDLDFAQVAPCNVQQEEEDEMQQCVQSENYEFFDPDRHPNLAHHDIGTEIGLAPRVESTEGEVLSGRISDDQYYKLIRSLNEKQQSALKHILKWIKSDKELLHLFITGGAGVGKSVLVNAVYQALHRYLCSVEGQDPENVRIVICAPTGKAAYNVHGMTIHRAFHILPNRGMKYSSLTCEKLNSLQVKYRDLKVVIVDEISMVGNAMFNFINLRLQEIKRSKKPFGGVHMIVYGDLYQLQPVLDGWIFQNLKSDYGALAVNLWQEYFALLELTQIMRQRDDLPFADLLNRLREGNHTQEDIAVLETRLLSRNNFQSLSNITHIYPTNAQVTHHNTEIFNKSLTQKAQVEAVDSILGDLAPSVKERIKVPDDPSVTCGLRKIIDLSIDLPYEITNNVNVEDGITNGSECVLKYIDYRNSSRDKPSILWVKFRDTKTGQVTRTTYKQYYHTEIDNNWTPIFAIKRQFHVGRNFTPVVRIQFPLVIGAAKTIHKSQGSSVDQLVISMNNKKMKHGHYVALSRIRTLSGLYIKDLFPDKISVDQSVVQEMARLRTSAVAQLCYTPPKTVTSQTLKIAFLNARSVHAHYPDIRSDHDLLHMDIMAFAESRLCSRDQNDAYSLEGFSICRNDQNSPDGRRPPHGIILYVRNDLLNIATHQSFTSNDFEASILHIESHNLQMVFLYRSPSSSLTQLFARLNDISHELHPQCDKLIVGDFNLDITNYHNKEHLNHIENIFLAKNIVQEVTTNYGSIVDLAFTNTNLQCSCIESVWSDHKILFIFNH